jgi:hypothetical protein
MEIVERRSLSRARLEHHLDELEAAADAGISVYVRPGHFADYLASIEADCGDWAREMRELPAGVAESETGLVLFWGDDRKEVLLPPFPVEAERCLPLWDGSSLRTLLAKRRLLGVVLLRLGGYSVGVFEGQRLLAHKTGQRFVKGRHKAGGQSQRRFARRREKQVRELFDAACSVVEAKLGPYERDIEHIFLGGDRLTLHSFLKRCPYLQRFADRIRGRILPVAEPRYKALRDMPEEIWKTEMLTLR